METPQEKKLMRLQKKELVDIIASQQDEIKNLRIELVERTVVDNLDERITTLRSIRGGKKNG